MAKVDYKAILDEAWQQHLAPKQENALTVISTFAGCGGSSLGYSMAGFRELLAIEWNDNAVETFKLNFPDIPVYHGDIAKLNIEQCLEMAGIQSGELDVLDGSPPCQGFSTAGKRILTDDRNQLFREFVRLLRGLQPRIFVMENVSGLIKGKMKLVFAEIMRELKISDYKVKCWLLNAMYFQVPQVRKRLIFIGVRSDMLEQPSYPDSQDCMITVKDAISDLLIEQDSSREHVWIDEWAKGTKWISIVPKIPQGGHLPCTGQYHRLRWNKPSLTLTKSGLPGMPAYVRNSHIHPSEHRALSVREMARLSSFPDEFHFANALREGNSCIGNSVPPLMMRAIARHIRQHILSG
jgi:DNA (cytosine-5)-methyltransferase 1